MKTLEEEKQFVEDIGILVERFGAQPLVSRMIALMVLRIPEGVAFEEFVEFLGASKSSISSGINFLMQMKHVVYFTKPGDRKRYFKIPFSQFWIADVEKKINEFDNVFLIMDIVKDFKKGANPQFDLSIDNARIFMKRLQILIKKEIKKFKDEMKNVQ